MKKIITTVGTSLFTNCLKSNNGIQSYYDRLEDKPYSESKENESVVNKLKDSVRSWMKDNADASAEIKSTIKIHEEFGEKIEVHLITTDTTLSNTAAELIKDYFDGNEKIKVFYKVTNDPTSDCIKGLQVNDNTKFNEAGIYNLANRIYQIYRSREKFAIIKEIEKLEIEKRNLSKNYKDNKEQVYKIQENINFKKEELKNIEDLFLNITGGFKGVIPYISILSQMMNIPIYYIFEDSNELLRLPELNIQFDWNEAEKNYFILTELKTGNKFNVDNEQKRMLKNQGLINRSNNLTGLGKFYKYFIENEMPQARNVFGFTVEHKIFEYLIQQSYKGMTTYQYLENSNLDMNRKNVENKPWVKEKGAEIDIVIKEKNCKINYPENRYIACEVKSLLQIENEKYFSNVRDQLVARLDLMKRDKCYSVEYHMYIYTVNDFKFLEKTLEVGKLLELNDKIKKHKKEILFKVFLVNYSLPKLSNNSNQYQTYFELKLTDKNFKEIKF